MEKLKVFVFDNEENFCIEKNLQLGNCLWKMLYFHLFYARWNIFHFVLSENAPNYNKRERQRHGKRDCVSEKVIQMDFSYTLMIIGVEVEGKKISLLNKGKPSFKEGHDFLIKNRSAKIQSKVQREVFLKANYGTMKT